MSEKNVTTKSRDSLNSSTKNEIEIDESNDEERAKWSNELDFLLSAVGYAGNDHDKNTRKRNKIMNFFYFLSWCRKCLEVKLREKNLIIS